MERIKFYHENDEIELISKYEVCDKCQGKGTHVNPAIDGNGLTREDFDEQGPEFFEDYMSGVYDVTCYECKGLRVVLVPDKKLNTEQHLEWYDDYLYELSADEKMRRMESGIYY